LNRLHESLICGSPFQSDVYRQDAHRHCKLGQWYYHNPPDSLRAFKGFGGLEEVHTRMHDSARMLAEKAYNRETISPEDYSVFYQNQQQLIQLLGSLRDALIETSYSFDPLTGAVNRHAFFMIAEKEHALSERTREGYVVAMIDLDHFKQINDRFGHLTGDSVLKVVADLFQHRLRSSDTFCRFGGEEFIAFLPSTRLLAAADLFTAILKALENTAIPADDSGEVIHVTASIGLAEHSAGQPFDNIIELADSQLYEAKRQGRNRVCYPALPL